MSRPSQIIRPDFVPARQRPTAPRTKVVAVLSIAIALLIAAICVRPIGAVTGVLLASSALVSCVAWIVYRKLGFAGDEDYDADDEIDPRDEYCV
jgi:hypothetical protein